MRKLPNEGQSGHVCQTGFLATQPTLIYTCIQARQPECRFKTLRNCKCLHVVAKFQRITVRIFVSVQRVFECAIVACNHRQHVVQLALNEPTVRVVLFKRPAHDVQALIDDLTAGQNQHWHRPLGRRKQQLDRFVF